MKNHEKSATENKDKFKKKNPVNSDHLLFKLGLKRHGQVEYITRCICLLRGALRNIPHRIDNLGVPKLTYIHIISLNDNRKK